MIPNLWYLWPEFLSWAAAGCNFSQRAGFFWCDTASVHDGNPAGVTLLERVRVVSMNSSVPTLRVLIAVAAAAVTSVVAHATVNSSPSIENAVSPQSLPQWAENTTVRVHVTLDAAGVPQAVKVAEWTPAELAHPVVAAVREWKFKPMIVDGRAVPSQVIVPVHLVRGSDDSVVRVASRGRKA